MFECNRDCISKKYHRLSVKNCTYELIMDVVKLGNDLVTVENYGAGVSISSPQIMNLGLKNRPSFEVSVKSLSCNFETSKECFTSMLKELNQPAFYAVFHKKSLKFTATDLEDIPRYRALDNFDWNLEIATPNNSIEYAFFASPNSDLIDKIEKLFVK